MGNGERSEAAARGRGRHRALAAWAAAGLLCAASASAQTPRAEIPLHGQDPESLAEVARQIPNPVRTLWTLTFDNYIAGQGGGGLPGVEPAYTGTFLAALPVGLDQLGLGRFDRAERFTLISQVTVPFVETLPVSPAPGADDRKSGFGDIQLVTGIAPVVREGLLWALGPTFIFPSASSDALGQGKWQAGPAAVFGYMNRRWGAYAFAEQWWSFAGDDHRPRTRQLSLQYALLRFLPGEWQVGMQPTLNVDWTAPRGDRLSLPVGLGAGKTIKIGKYPVQFWLEVDYYAVRQAGPTPRWGLNLQITPTIPEPE